MAEKIIEKAMESGVLKQRNVVGVITGLMGSGKTTLLHRLFGMPPPKVYSSSGVAEPCRGFLHHIVCMSADGTWERITIEHICEYLVPLFKAGIPHTKVIDHAQDLLHAIDPTPIANSMFSSASAPSPSSCEPKESYTTGQLVDKFKRVDLSEKKPRDVMLDLVHMVDTGGQPEMMEVMPSLIHNANLAMVVFNLEYGLTEHQPIAYYSEGVEYQHQISQYTTGEEVILKLVSTLHAKRTVCKDFHLLVVATHRDCVPSDLKKRVADLNGQLRELLLPAFESELIVFGKREIAFVLNLKEPDENDEYVLNLIRKVVSNPDLGPKPFIIPAKFFAFEQDLFHFSIEVANRDILTLDECKRVGEKLKMTDREVVIALIFFHYQNTFLYFRQVLPNHVFINPQVPLKIVNNIVRFSYMPLQGTTAKAVNQLRDGIITEELLGHEKVSPHFVEGIYEVHDAIMLFCHTFTLAPLQPETPNQDIVDRKKAEYLMMCLKPTIPDKELNDYIPNSTDMTPIIATFSNGCVPLGCFGCTVSCLISIYGWTVVSDDDPTKAKCLAHNIALLHDPDANVDVILVNSIKYIQIHISSDLTHCQSPAEICSSVRRKVFLSVEKVIERMQLDQKQVEIRPAFLCSCTKEHRHTAEYMKYFLRCTKYNKRVNANQQQLLWMGEDTSLKPDLPELIRLEIPERVGAKYYQIFGTLILDDKMGYIVPNIERSSRDIPEHIVINILREWLTREPTPVTWENLMQILRDSGLNRLAKDVNDSLQQRGGNYIPQCNFVE